MNPKRIVVNGFTYIQAGGLSAVLYHRTTLHSALEILSKDQFRLSTSAGTLSDDSFHDKGKQYFFSMARSPAGAFNGHLTLVLDGAKLGQRYSGGPVDYWGREFRKVKPTSAELEDRIFHNKPIIPTASKYIKSIHLHTGKHWRKEWNRGVVELLSLAKTRSIPVFVYNDESAYKILYTPKALPSDQIDLDFPSEEPYKSNLPEATYDLRLFDAVLELCNKTPGDTLSAQAKDIVRDLRWGREAASSIMAAIHNRKSHPHSDEIVAYLQKKRMTVPELVAALAKKWEKV